MSDNKKYYYMKVKEIFFDSEEMKILEAQQNGIEYQLFYMKICLLSLKSDGALIFKDFIPYDASMISSITRTNIDTVKTALEIFQRIGLIIILEQLKTRPNTKPIFEFRDSLYFYLANATKMKYLVIIPKKNFKLN